MSKEMTVIALGVWVLLVPYLAVPGPWRTAILIVTGIAIAITGFLLRGEALYRGLSEGRKRENHTFVESTMSAPARHDYKEGINSLN